ncbi:MAG: hypothetical protein MJ135_03530 [Oscillospiraceae bacterium]|nr:hypothetical protein [Oscillospiraceae bacterium]
MNLMIAIDERCAMQFNGRRQSRDRELIRRILQQTSGKKLWICPDSAELFEGVENANIAVSEAAAEMAGEGEFCFVENPPLSCMLPRIERFFVYRWNRKYPGDVFPDLRPWEAEEWKLENSCEFAGYSHEQITEDIYIRMEPTGEN